MMITLTLDTVSQSVDSDVYDFPSFKVFESSEFGSHPLLSVSQGGLDLQQVSIELVIWRLS